jgi:hypothetical protein
MPYLSLYKRVPFPTDATAIADQLLCVSATLAVSNAAGVPTTTGR